MNAVSLQVHLFKDSEASFIELLDQKDIKFNRRIQLGEVMASGAMLLVLEAVQAVTPWGALAWVIVEWLKNKRHRKVIITTEDNQVVHAEGLSEAELQQVLQQAKSLAAIDTGEKK